jgi:hypothetical protein
LQGAGLLCGASTVSIDGVVRDHKSIISGKRA